MKIDSPAISHQPQTSPISEVGNAAPTSATSLREQLYALQLEDRLQSTIDSAQSLLGGASSQKNAHAGTVNIDDALAQFWDTEDDMMDDAAYRTGRPLLEHNRDRSLGILESGVDRLRGEVNKMPAGTERDQALSKLDDFLATGRTNIANTFQTGLDALNRRNNPHQPHAVIPPNLGLLEEDAAGDSTALNATTRLANPGMDDEEELPPSRIRLPRTPAEILRNPAEADGDDDDSITFRMPAPPNPRSMEHLSDMRLVTEKLSRISEELRSTADGARGRLSSRD